MCTFGYSAKNEEDVAYALALVLNAACSGTMSPLQLRKLIATRWDRICVLAHKIHDEETSEARKLEEAITQFARLGTDGIRNVISGNAASDVIAACKLVAKKIGT